MEHENGCVRMGKSLLARLKLKWREMCRHYVRRLWLSHCAATWQAIASNPMQLLTRIGASILLGWNEKRDVCEQAAILAGDSNYQKVGCSDVNEGSGGK